MKIQNRNRAMLLAVVGGYVIYLAYEIMRDELAGKAAWPCGLRFCVLPFSARPVLPCWYWRGRSAKQRIRKIKRNRKIRTN